MCGWLGDYKPYMAMVLTQVIYAGISLFTRVALEDGMSSRVFVAYRQAIATVVLAPIAYFFRRSRETNKPSLGLRSASLIFLAALIGVTINQNAYFEGLSLTSAWITIAATNLIPAITFLIAYIARLEKANMRSLRGIAKVIGTAICVSGAICMAVFKGPELLSSQYGPKKAAFNLGGENLLLGCLCVFGACCCWSIWLILQVPITDCYPDHLSLSAWTCFFSTLQSAVFALCLDRDREAWILRPNMELASCIYSAVIGSGVTFFLQSYSIAEKGPLFSAIFYPLGTVVVTIFAPIFLHEDIYTGSLIGAVLIIIGLYMVLWGKAEDHGAIQKEENLKKADNGSKLDLEESLLSN